MSWESKPLEQLGVITSSKRIYKKEYVKSGVPFFRTKEIKELANGKEIATELFISRERYLEILDKFGVPKKGDILLTAIGTIGEVYVVNNANPFYFKDGNVLWLKEFKDLSPYYLRYALLSFVGELNALSNGAAYNALPINKLKQHNILVPPEYIQNKIVTFLDNVFADIDQARLNTEKNLRNAREVFDSYLQQVFSECSERWKQTTLNDLCNKFEYGTSSKSSQEGEVPVIRMGNIQDGSIVMDKLVYSLNEDDNQKYRLNFNDILFNRTNSAELVGKTAIYKSEEQAIFAGYLIRIHRNEKLLNADYLNFYLNSPIARRYGEQVMSQSTNQANISGSKLKMYPINVPASLEEQQVIVEKISILKERTEELEATYKSKLKALDELKKSLLQQAFTGQLTQG
ncbi:restriction endonuclease subunit S (plasmid) [Vibrio gigantis]|uniref:restriction endonuclease subunit S n=1 Tax=Vibrio gigantis TaxID=296199 RepID=UPI001EFA6C7A|nr:restriction endonuclease subunit S [Vibrio gigantis]ULN67380.1 restriction endonuclease subunit S [Vibrio gigantis]